MIRRTEPAEAERIAEFLDRVTLVNRWLVAFFKRLGEVPPEALPEWSFWVEPGGKASGEGARPRAVIAHSFHTAVSYLGAGTRFDPAAIEGLLEEQLLPEKLVGDLPAMERLGKGSPRLLSRAVRREEMAVLALPPGAHAGKAGPLAGFRAAVIEDAPRLREFERLSAEELGEEDPRSDFASLIEGGLIFVCEAKGEVAGVIRSNLSDGRYIHVGGFYVAPGFRGSGVGSKLLRGLARRIHQGGDTALLDTYRSNAAALAAFRKAGFQEVGSGLALWFPADSWNRPG